MTAASRRGQTIFLTGPNGAGKTTTSTLWAAQRNRPTVALDTDQIKGTLKRIGGDELSDELGKYNFPARIAAAQVDNITRSGVDCILAALWWPWVPGARTEFRYTWAELAPLNPIIVVLLPRADVCIKRTRNRPAKFAIDPEQLRAGHHVWDLWRDCPRTIVLDTSESSQQEVLEAAEEAVHKIAATEGQPAAEDCCFTR